MSHYDSCREYDREHPRTQVNQNAKTPVFKRDLDKEIADAAKKLAKLQEEKAKKPKPFTLYVHTNKEDMYSSGEELGLSDELCRKFMYTGSEIKIEGTITDSTFHATHVNGVALVEPTEL